MKLRYKIYIKSGFISINKQQYYVHVSKIK